MTRRTASNMTPPAWNMNPIMLNLISPKDAMMTPITMNETLNSVLKFAGDTPRVQVVMRTATGVVAWPLVSSCSSLFCV